MGCCEDKGCEVAALRERRAGVLRVVLAVNAIMFLVEFAAGVAAGSTSLLADALDMLGDALVYGFSLYVIGRGAAWEARAALAKGGFMLLFGLAVLAEAAWKAVHPAMPDVPVMAAVGALALAANTGCFVLLWRHRDDGLNMRSTWLCSRNDLVANAGVLLAAAAGHALASRWPDIAVGVAIAALFLRSALQVLRESLAGLRSAAAGAR